MQRKQSGTDATTNEIWTAKDIARAYAIPQGTLRYWRALGSGPPWFQLSERIVRYRRADVERERAFRGRGGLAF